MQWSLEDIYKKQVRGKIPPRKHLRVLGEDVSLYTKEQGEYKHIGDVSDDNFLKISRIATSGNAQEEIENYLTTKKYESNSFKGADSYINLVELLDRGAFEVYINNTDKPSLANRPGPANMIDIASKLGLDSSIAERVANFQPIDAGGSNVGPGEILAALIFDDVTNSTTGGDLMLGNDKLEVKGQGGRFGQQGSRGGVSLSLDPLLKDLDNKPEFPAKTGMELILHTVANAYKDEDKANKFIPNLHTLLKQVYPGGNLDYFHDDVDFNELTSRKRPGGVPAIHGIIRRNLAKLNLDYYAKEKKVNLLLFTKGVDGKTKTPGKVGDYALFTVEDALTHGGLIDQGILRATAFSPAGLYPNFKYYF